MRTWLTTAHKICLQGIIGPSLDDGNEYYNVVPCALINYYCHESLDSLTKPYLVYLSAKWVTAGRNNG